MVGSVVPMVIEQDGWMERSFDIYSRLLRERIVFLGQEVNDDIANLIAAQLLFLDAEEPGKDISLYVNSPGGSAYAGMAIYDAMQRPLRGPGPCASDGHERGRDGSPAAFPARAVPERKDQDPPASAGSARRLTSRSPRGNPGMTKRMAEIISRHSGQDVDQVLRDIDRDRFMTPEEAVEYGLVDAIMEPRAALVTR
jgi:ATP-dependent Clp protease protease subunit